MSTDANREYMRLVGARLKAVRLLNKLTQQDAANAIGITQAYLSAVERGLKSSCTAQIISLIRFYKVPYEVIFGSHKGSYTLEEFPANMKFSDCTELLGALIGKNCPTLESGAESCLKICVYMLLRTIYRKNPRNSEKIFSVEYETAMELCAKFISQAPENISLYISRSREINSRSFEIPVEQSGTLRAFVAECENAVTEGLDKIS